MEKNKLQEYFQKYGKKLPIYDQIRCGGTDHNPMWISTVILPSGEQFTSDVCKTKTQSDCNSAKKALSYLNSERKQSQVISEIPPNTITLILIDIDNSLPPKEIPKDHCIIGFNSTYSTSYKKKHNFMIKTIDSGYKDAADHLMGFWLGKMCTSKFKKLKSLRNIFIISGDTSLENLPILLRNEGYNSKMIRNYH